MSGSLRENVGKKDAKKHRKEGNVPCVLYGGKEQTHFIVTELGFKKLVFTPDVFIVNLNIDGTEYKSILQDVQYHPVTDRVLHADFLEVVPNKPLIVGLPLTFEGTSPGVIRGGKMIKFAFPSMPKKCSALKRQNPVWIRSALFQIRTLHQT